MSHQTRRDPLPVDYQYPTHGVDCDCPPCRMRAMNMREIAWFAIDFVNENPPKWRCVNAGICDGTERVWLGRIAYCAKCGSNALSGVQPVLYASQPTTTGYGFGV